MATPGPDDARGAGIARGVRVHPLARARDGVSGAQPPTAALPIRYRAAAGATGLVLGSGLGLMLVYGEVTAAIVGSVLAAVLPLGARAAAPRALVHPLGAIIALSYALHVALIPLIYFGSLALGRGGFITGDDAGYAQLACAVAQFVRGEPQHPFVPPDWGGDGYLLGTWVYLESAIFLVFGQRVLVALLLNAAFAAGVVMLVFDLARRLFDARAALVAAAIVAFYPSLVLWSSLNLKDSLVLLLISLCLWCVLRFQFGRHWLSLAGAFTLLVLMESLRSYIFAGLAIVIPIGVFLVLRADAGTRARWTGVAAAGSLALLALNPAGFGPGGLLAALESTRQGMAVGARTAFVSVPLGASDSGTQTGTSPSWSAAAELPPTPARVDLSCLEGGVAQGGPPAQRGPTLGRPDEDPTTGIQLLPASGTYESDELLPRTLSYLPTGIVYALFAPFPWAATRSADLLTAPEMLLWYGLLAAMPFTFWRARSLWRLWLPTLLFASGTLIVFALSEGNVGTLYRHRSMVIPFVVVLASPAIVVAMRWARLLLRSR